MNNQIELFTQNAYRNRLTEIEDISVESIAKMDEIQIYELGLSLYETMDYWIETMQSRINNKSKDYGDYHECLMDITGWWVVKIYELQVYTGFNSTGTDNGNKEDGSINEGTAIILAN